jgi:beta-lactamase regulating signal transducer with metallopeptidase domain/Tol biopolymer transport system component
MNIIEIINRAAEAWSNYMLDQLFDVSWVLVVALIFWMLVRKRAPAQFGYILFLLVLLKLFISFEIPVPKWSTETPETRSVDTAESHTVATATTPDAIRANLPSLQNSSESLKPTMNANHISAPTNEPFRQKPEAATTSTPSTVGMIAPVSLTFKSHLMLLWICIVTLLLCCFGWSQICVRRLLRQSVTLDIQDFPFDFDRLKKQMGIINDVRISTHPTAPIPAAVGLLRPQLILPQDFLNQYSVSQMKWIISHELAHIRRHDLFVALSQRILQIIFFFHPAIWISNWMIKHLREYACDDLALTLCKGNRKDYGESLLNVIERWHSKAKYCIAQVGIVSHKSQIKGRIMRIIDSKRSIAVKLSSKNILILLFTSFLLLPNFVPSKISSNTSFPNNSLDDNTAAPQPSIEDSNTSYNFTRSSHSGSMTLKKLPNVESLVNFSLPSSDGKYIAGIEWKAGNLFMKSLESGEIKHLIDKGNLDVPDVKQLLYVEQCAISPDDKKVVYIWNNGIIDRHEIWIVYTDGSNDRFLYRNSDYTYFDSIKFINNQYISFMANSDGGRYQNDLVILNLTNSNDTILFSNPHLNKYISTYSVSSNLKHIAYDMKNDRKSPTDIYLYDLDSKKEICLVDHPAGDHLLGWSPDGQWLLFSSNRLGSDQELWGIQLLDKLSFSEPVFFGQGIGSPIANSVSSTGTLYFSNNKIITDIYTVSIDFDNGNFLAPPKTINESMKFPQIYGDFWAPDGNHILFGYREDNIINLYSVQDSATKRVACEGYSSSCPSFWMDNEHIIFGFYGSSPHSLYKINVFTGDKKVICDLDENGDYLLHGYFASKNMLIYSRKVRGVDYSKFNLSLLADTAPDKITAEGKSLVIVALVNDKLHFRIFDAQGQMVFDKAESMLKSVSEFRVNNLKKLVTPLMTKANLSREQKQSMIRSVVSILNLNQRQSFLIKRNLETNEESTLREDNRSFFPIKISPDMNWIAARASGNPDTSDVLKIISLDDANVNRVLFKEDQNDKFRIRWISWMPDSKSILLTLSKGFRERTTAFWKVSLNDDPPKKLFESPGDFMYPQVSPDGKQLGFTVRNRVAEYWAMENFLPSE